MGDRRKNMLDVLERIAFALEGGEAASPVDWTQADLWVWQGALRGLKAVSSTHVLPLDALVGLEQQREILLRNTRQFAAGLPANNALLWGARGTGKSSLVKAVHAAVVKDPGAPLALIEIYREDLRDLPVLLDLLRAGAAQGRRFLLFCDDLTFETRDDDYKFLKSLLEGGVESAPENVLFYATSNRRHLVPRSMTENEQRTAIHPGEAVEESVSLSDRFGIWLGFHPCDQATYLEMVRGYADYFSLKTRGEALEREALQWAAARGARSGRVAWQFIQDLRGREGGDGVEVT